MRAAVVLLLLVAACAGDDPAVCESTPVDSRPRLRCEAEFTAQSARPLDSSLPGARSVKTLIDRAHGNAPYFLDTTKYPLHSAFAVARLGYPPGAPFVNEYLAPSRRFFLGAVTHYEEPDVWAYELAPYDTATAEMIEESYHALADRSFFAGKLAFHPTSQAQAELDLHIPVVSTDTIYAGTSYQPLNLGETYGQVRLLTADQLGSQVVGARELVILDRVPNDISVVAGVITEAFQTPLSHVNVLSQQRGTPNMALRNARSLLAAHEGKWVHLTVGAFDYQVVEVTADEANAWWQAHGPPPAVIPEPDYAVSGLLHVDDLSHDDLRAIGGKAANYAELRKIGPPVMVRDAFVIPAVHYRDFMQQNGFDAEVTALLARDDFRNDGNVRRSELQALQARMKAAPVDPALLAAIESEMTGRFPGLRMKFRSSTNAEDLEHHTGAGLYDSQAGAVGDPAHPIADAVRTVWASVWNFRAFEERSWSQIDHQKVAMAILVNPSFSDELANGVAISANIYDPEAGGEDAFYVNAQRGEASVVSPDPQVTCDSLLYFFFHANQPATYFTHSSLAPLGVDVLDRDDLFDLGQQLAAIREHFAAIFTPPEGYGALPMDVEWKLVSDGAGRHIEIKQARPYPGRGH